MSKDKIHIDDLFKKLSDHSPELENNAWAEMSDRIHDGAWQKKFADFEPIVEEEDFPLIVHSVSDIASSPVKPSRLWTVLLLLFLFVASMTWVAISYVQMINKSKANKASFSVNSFENQNKSSQTSPNVLAKEEFKQSETKKEEMNENSVSNSENNLNVLDIKPSKQTASNNNLSKSPMLKKPKQSLAKYDKQKENSPNIINLSDLNPVEKEIKKDNILASKDKEKPEIKKNDLAMLIENEKVKTENENSDTEISEEESEEQIESTNQDINKLPEVAPELANKPVVDSTKSANNDSIKKETKWGLYANIGMGALLANPPFADASRKMGERFFVNIEASRKNLSFRSGIDFQHFSFTNQQIIYRKVDSIPHLNPQGDTIGWFQTNPRDTTKSGRYNSDFRVVSVPIGFNYTLLKRRKMELVLGVGGNFNFIRSRGFYVLDENKRHVLENSSGNTISRFEAGYYLDFQVKYALNKKTKIFVGSGFNQIRDISRSQNFDLRLSGYSLTFGLNYLLK